MTPHHAIGRMFTSKASRSCLTHKLLRQTSPKPRLQNTILDLHTKDSSHDQTRTVPTQQGDDYFPSSYTFRITMLIIKTNKRTPGTGRSHLCWNSSNTPGIHTSVQLKKKEQNVILNILHNSVRSKPISFPRSLIQRQLMLKSISGMGEYHSAFSRGAKITHGETCR